MTVALSPDPHPRVAALIRCYATADTAMRDLPIYNPALTVEAHGFAPLPGAGLFGVLITPWFMNLVLLPDPAELLDPARYGRVRKLALPRGEHPFRYAGDAGLGAIWTAALHSPMEVFKSQGQARAEARQRLTEALTPPVTASEAVGCPGRRAFFGATRAQT